MLIKPFSMLKSFKFYKWPSFICYNLHLGHFYAQTMKHLPITTLNFKIKYMLPKSQYIKYAYPKVNISNMSIDKEHFIRKIGTVLIQFVVFKAQSVLPRLISLIFTESWHLAPMVKRGVSSSFPVCLYVFGMYFDIPRTFTFVIVYMWWVICQVKQLP